MVFGVVAHVKLKSYDGICCLVFDEYQSCLYVIKEVTIVCELLKLLSKQNWREIERNEIRFPS